MHEALAWKCTSANPLASIEAGNGLADLEPLRGVIGDARIVSHGRATRHPRVLSVERPPAWGGEVFLPQWPLRGVADRGPSSRLRACA
jgi:hypothetical protein